MVEDVERLGLATVAVERDHELLAEALALGVLGGELLELGDDAAVLAVGELGRDEVLPGAQAALVEAGGLDPEAQPVADVEQGRAAPQPQRALQQVDGLGGPAGDAARPEVGQVAEAVRVDGIGVDVEHVTAAQCSDQFIPWPVRYPFQQFSQTHHICL